SECEAAGGRSIRCVACCCCISITFAEKITIARPSNARPALTCGSADILSAETKICKSVQPTRLPLQFEGTRFRASLPFSIQCVDGADSHSIRGASLHKSSRL